MPRPPRIAWLVIVLLALPFFMAPAVGSEPPVKPLPETKAELEAKEIDEQRATRNWLDSPWGDLVAEFERICGQVKVAPSLNEAEIRLLIEDCKALREALLQSENPQAKILLKRLQMCEDFFEYALEVHSEADS